MKIHYRKPNLLEEMLKAIADTADSKEPIDHFELTHEEFNQHYSSFNKTVQRDNSVQYLFRGILIKIAQTYEKV